MKGTLNTEAILRKLALVISTVLHPVFIPFYTVLIYFQITNYYFFDYEKLIRLFFIMAILIPLLIYYVLYKFQIVKSFYLTSRQGRFYAVFFMFLVYISMSNLMNNMAVLHDFHVYFQGVYLSLLIALLFLFFSHFRISLHTLALSGTFVFFVLWAITYRTNILYLFVLLILAMLMVVISRLFLRAHSITEIFLGILAGVAGMLSAYAISLYF